jgi:hypothetical protein
MVNDKNAYVSNKALMTVIKRRGLQPDQDGNYHITDEIIAEAEAFDIANGDRPPPEAIKQIDEALKHSDHAIWISKKITH